MDEWRKKALAFCVILCYHHQKPLNYGEKPKRAKIKGKDTARLRSSQGLSPMFECGKRK